MAQRSNHYDAAFEELLRQSRIPYVCVDERRRALLADASLKSMDFIVYADGGANLLIDVKGRRFPSGSSGHRWESWATQDDVDCLRQWEQVFGGDFQSLLVFAYDVVDPRHRAEHASCFPFRGRTYAFYGVRVDEYGDVMRTRSRSWETVSLPAAEFRRLRTPIHEFLGPATGRSPTRSKSNLRLPVLHETTRLQRSNARDAPPAAPCPLHTDAGLPAAGRLPGPGAAAPAPIVGCTGGDDHPQLVPRRGDRRGHDRPGPVCRLPFQPPQLTVPASSALSCLAAFGIAEVRRTENPS